MPEEPIDSQANYFQGHSREKYNPFSWLLRSRASVKVSVYYESLCPDSQLFVYNQVAPIFQMFGPEELEVDLNPFGKANVREFFK